MVGWRLGIGIEWFRSGDFRVCFEAYVKMEMYG